MGAHSSGVRIDGDKDPFTLSRGRAPARALASLIAVEPEILILDEPTTGLDYRECMHIMGLVRELNPERRYRDHGLP